MRCSGAALFSAALAAVAAFAVYTALRWPPKAALFPLVMGIPLLVLAVAQLLVDLRERPAAAPESARAWGILAWMVAFILLVLLLGFPIAVPVFVLAYLVTSGREGWLLSDDWPVSGCDPVALPEIAFEPFKKIGSVTCADDKDVAAVVLVPLAPEIAERAEGVQGTGDNRLRNSEDLGQSSHRVWTRC